MMALEAGTKLGPYEILSPLGAGGMGEVYRAKDTRLDRDVAIKVLPSHLTNNAKLKQRFEREAKVISSLTHPNICTLHDIGHQDGVDYLVMELIEGDTLARRIAKGALPLEDLLRVGAEIASALDKAHRAGIVHRDLKPGNIMLTKSGAKLLDFGLAKNTPGQSGLPAAPDAVTITKPLTREGSIVGTFQYMAPEQLEGKEADQQTDIFAFGAVLYEMATGKRAFEGSSRASLIASIMSSQPRAISELQPMTPPALEHLVRTCLAKSREDRIQTAHDVKLQLQWIAEGGSQLGAPAPIVAKRKTKDRFLLITTAVLFVATVVLGVAYLRNASSTPVMVTASIRPPTGVRFVFTNDAGGPAVISPDGKNIAFTGRCEDGINRLWVRPLNDGAARVLPGTDDCTFPFWSPDGQSVAFFAHEKLSRTPITGGLPVTICDALLGKGGSWSASGEILFAPYYIVPIARVPASGGTPTPVTKLDEGKHSTHRWPVCLPDGKHFLYFAGNHDLSQRGNDGIFFASLDGSVNKKVVATRGNVVYASGHLLYLRNDTLMAQRFDPKRGEFTGDPKPVAYDVQYDGGVWRGVFSASDNGVLIYQTGLAPSGTTLTWFDRTGKDLGNFSDQALYDNQLRISPDGNKIVVAVGGPSDVWTFDLNRGIRTRVTAGPVEERPALWSPDGSKIVYTSRNRPDKRKILYITQSSGTGEPQPLFESDRDMRATDYSPDGKFVLISIRDRGLDNNVALVTLEDTPRFIPLITKPLNEDAARFSPDGRWIAYASNESGREEVYVIPFCSELNDDGSLATCDRSGRWQVSTRGGTRPAWARDGKTLYFQTLDRTLHAAAVDTTGDSFKVQTSQPLFTPDAAVTNRPGRNKGGYAYDVTPDGKRFLINTFGSGDATPLTLVLNWTNMVSQP